MASASGRAAAIQTWRRGTARAALAAFCSGAAALALAQTTGADPAAAQAATSAASPGASDGAEAAWRATVTNVLLLSLLSVMLAHLLTGWVLRRYERRMEALMRDTSEKVFGGHAPRARAWSADELLAGIGSRRRAMTLLLVAVVLLYVVLASLVMAANDGVRSTSSAGIAQAVTSVLLFSSFAAPVVLLGVSAAQFDRIFWRWFAPLTFLAVAMQGALGYGDPAAAGAAGAQTADGSRPALELLPAFAALVALMAFSVLAMRRGARLLPGGVGRWLAARPWRRRAALAPVLVAALVVGAGVLGDGAGQRFVTGALMGAIAIGIIWYALVDRVRRIVAPLLATGLFALIGSFSVTLWVLSDALPALGTSLTPLGSVVTAVVVALLASNFVLSWVGLAYEQKVFSDAQFQVFCWMLTAGALALIVVGLLTPDGARTDLLRICVLLAGCTALALLAYWIVMRYAFRPLPSGKRLMVLRVFSAERRGERLLDELEERWRTIGPIMLIGGTDVAKRTIDPAKAANFVRRRLADICVPNRFMLDKRIAAMDELPDPDGRYRVNEFLCTDDLWQEAVTQLLDRADAIVLDLSEFTAERRGTAWELALLKARSALERTVFLVSAQTDQQALRHALELAPEAPLPAGAVIEVDLPVDGLRLVEALVRRMEPAAAVQPPGLPPGGLVPHAAG
jgi:flagellar biogenesis protein FliO